MISFSKAHISFYSNKGMGLWLIIKSSIYSFHITHSTFILTMWFHLDLIQPSTSNLLTCECEHELNVFGTHLAHCPFGSQWIITHDAIRDVMYALAQKSGHVVWIEQWYIFMSKASLWTNLHMTREDQVFVANVVVINLTRRQWLWVSLVDQQVQMWNLMSLLKYANIEDFMKGTTLL